MSKKEQYKPFSEVKTGDTLYFVDYSEDLSITEVPVTGVSSDRNFVNISYKPVFNDIVKDSPDNLKYLRPEQSAAYGFYTTKKQALTDAKQQALSVIMTIGEKMNKMRDDILDMSRIIANYDEMLKEC